MFIHDGRSICTEDRFNGELDTDGGNPMISDTNGLVGIVSWFAHSKSKPDIFTSILPYIYWIESWVKSTRCFEI